MTKRIIEIEIEVPEGYDVIGYRLPKKGEFYCEANGSKEVHKSTINFKNETQIILKPITPETKKKRKRVVGKMCVGVSDDSMVSSGSIIIGKVVDVHDEYGYLFDKCNHNDKVWCRSATTLTDTQLNNLQMTEG